jgi:hypothetical protein
LEILLGFNGRTNKGGTLKKKIKSSYTKLKGFELYGGDYKLCNNSWEVNAVFP